MQFFVCCDTSPLFIKMKTLMLENERMDAELEKMKKKKQQFQNEKEKFDKLIIAEEKLQDSESMKYWKSCKTLPSIFEKSWRK